MANGDTKTEAMLNVLGNGGTGDEFRGCCNTKTQQYILDAIDRVQGVEDEVEELKNNPDVVDIVDTYQDLQDYDTSTLTDKDVIRVLSDSTHSGISTYYRWNSTTNQFDFVGEIAGGGGGITKLTTADYNWNSTTWQAENPNAIALWLLDEGFYTTDNSANIYVNNSTSIQNTAVEGNIIYVSHKYAILSSAAGTLVSISFFGGRFASGMPAGRTFVTDATQGYDATNVPGHASNVLSSANLKQTTGTSTTDVMSQKAVTDILGDIETALHTINNGTGD